MVRAIVITRDQADYHVEVSNLSSPDFEPAEITLKVLYSSINYKDALAITGRGPVVRQFPMIPGIDLVGEIVTSQNQQWQRGDRVLITGWGMGEVYWGGLSELAQVPAKWLIALPPRLTPKTAIAIGTAGLTAMLAVMALEKAGISPEQGPILVTGSSGGVGSFSIGLLARLGYQVIASTGTLAATDYLLSLGATSVIERTELNQANKPLLKQRWAAAIDTLGSHTLANVLAGTQRDGVVMACGMAQGLELPASVAPFILRGITLKGIDSVYCQPEIRQTAWQRFADLTSDAGFMQPITETISLEQVIPYAMKLLEGNVRGRIIVDCQTQNHTT